MFENSVQVQPNYYTYSNLGVLYYKEGNYDKAAQMYREALKINNNDYLMWGNLAVAQHYILGKSNESLDTYNKAISMAEKEMKINANDPEIISNLAGYYADVDDTTNAIELLNKSLKIAPDNSAVMYRAATINEHFKNREKALYWITKALKNGYSRSEIEQEPELKELTSDGRYKQLASELNKNNDK
jgi:eukaryotic-like serine/threonine-protein kinase